MAPVRRKGSGKRSVLRPRPRGSGARKHLGSTLSTAVIWVLVAVNLVLVASLISRIVSPKNPPRASLESQDSLKVEVLNGCGKPGLAKEVTDYLRNKGFDVVNFGNYHDFNVRKTLVIDRRSMDLHNAQKVASALGVESSEVLAELNETRALDVTVILGKDYAKLKPYRD
ncbi:MAG: LytR C-terminal domain-containing protein [candidate division KSB1 bacterium]|nr:LytR C-terminal domain-containing protein [candidate division KSB1 bacterium]